MAKNINDRATHETRKKLETTGKRKRVIVDRIRDERGVCFVVRNMRGKPLKTYKKKQMAKFNEKYISLAMKNKELKDEEE